MSSRYSGAAATVLLVLLCGMAAAAGLNQDSPWPKFRRDHKNTGRTDFTGPAAPTLSWTFKTNDFIASSPSIGVDGTIYVGSGIRRGNWSTGETDSSLYALNPDGTLKWQFKTEGGVFSSPTIDSDGTIYVASIDGFLYALEDSLTYGKLRWKTGLGNMLGSPALDHDGNIYIGNVIFQFFALDMDGSILWDYQTGWCVISTAAVDDDGTVFIGSKDHNLFAFDKTLEAPRWAFSTGTFFDGHLVDGSPAIGPDGTVYVGSDPYGAAGHGHLAVPVDTNFWAVNPDGTMKWAFATGDGVESSPAIGSDGTVYFGSYDSCFYAVADSGTYGFLKWKFKTGGAIDGSPAIDGDGIIYFGSQDSTLYALYPDGSVKWTYATGGGIESSPTIDDNGFLYVGSFDSSLYAIGTGAPDIGVIGIDVPGEILASELHTPLATLRNFRGIDQDCQAVCVIDTNGTAIYTDTLSVPGLAGGESTQVSFAPWAVGPDTALAYNIAVMTLLPADENGDNDTAAGWTTAVMSSVLCGDANGDKSVNVGDAVYLINYIFKSGAAPDPLCAGDSNGDLSVNVGDAVFLINYVFKGEDPPLEPCCP